MAFKISRDVQNKLHEKHLVSIKEVKQCFSNKHAGDLEDSRAEHKTDPPTKWFISETDKGRQLKIIYMIDSAGNIHLKSAYPPEGAAVSIYNRFFPEN